MVPPARFGLHLHGVLLVVSCGFRSRSRYRGGAGLRMLSGDPAGIELAALWWWLAGRMSVSVSTSRLVAHVGRGLDAGRMLRPACRRPALVGVVS